MDSSAGMSYVATVIMISSEDCTSATPMATVRIEPRNNCHRSRKVFQESRNTVSCLQRCEMRRDPGGCRAVGRFDDAAVREEQYGVRVRRGRGIVCHHHNALS